MIRNVSREDYLLARGANPRTGIVTPGSHSANSSIDEVQELKSRGLVPPGKWRQRGNQWISLEFGQPTPLPTPSADSGCPDPTLRTPPRLTASKYNHGRPAQSAVAPIKSSLAHCTDYGVGSETDVPGSYPQTPVGIPGQPPQATLAGSSIPRKPIGCPTSTPTSGQRPPAPALGAPGPSQPPAMTATPISGQRSSSAPTPWKPYPFSPMDVGKDLPKPLTVDHASAAEGNNSPHFLGRQKPRSASGASSVAQANTIRKLDKELPCLPTSNGLSPSSRTTALATSPKIKEWNAIRLNEGTGPAPTRPTIASPPHRQMGSQDHPVPRGPRDLDNQVPFARPRRPPRPPGFDHPTMRPIGARTMGVPVYDNPPPREEQNLRRTPERRDLNQNRLGQRTIPTNFDDILLAPIGISTSISTSTDILTGTVPIKQMRPVNEIYRPTAGKEAGVPNRCRLLDSVRHPSESVGMNMCMSPNDLIGMPSPKGAYRPRATSRPQMLERSDAMQPVPTLKPHQQRPRRRGRDTAPSHQWSMIGMPITPSTALDADGNHMVNADQDSQTTDAQVQPQVKQKESESLACGRPGQSIQSSCTDGLYRKCSRCSHGFVQDRPQMNRLVGRDSPTDTIQATSVGRLDCVEEVKEGAFGAASCKPVLHEQATPMKPEVPNDVAVQEEKPTEHSADAGAEHAELLAMNIVAASKIMHAAAISNASLLRPDVMPRRGSENPLEVVLNDKADHTGCCPQCCKESDCHDGCLGHPSPSATPSSRSIPLESHPSSKSGSITSLEGQPLTPLSERNKALSFVKVAFRKGFQKSNITSKETQSPITSSRITRAADIDLIPTELSCAPMTPGGDLVSQSAEPGTRSGTNLAATAARSAIELRKSPTDSITEAATAAKSAMGMKTPTESRRPGVLVKKRKDSKDEGKGDHKHGDSTQAKRKMTPNEGRAVSRPPTIHDAASVKSVTRAASVISKASTADIPLPPTTIGAVVETVLIPLEVSRMWLRNHPSVSKSGGQVLDQIWKIAMVVLETSEGCWRMVYVYSKTGKWRAPKLKGEERRGGWLFVRDCMRSIGYLFVLVALLVLCIRIIRWGVGVARIVFFVLRAMLWVCKVLLGGGTGW